ncbi:hypothetical protein AZA_74473 [Nitrospirillum viridazoti Y2]|nr:hypothetical protein AZA_74473 [Nitrospirillum amazonense Y2]
MGRLAQLSHYGVMVGAQHHGPEYVRVMAQVLRHARGQRRDQVMQVARLQGHPGDQLLLLLLDVRLNTILHGADQVVFTVETTIDGADRDLADTADISEGELIVAVNFQQILRRR